MAGIMLRIKPFLLFIFALLFSSCEFLPLFLSPRHEVIEPYETTANLKIENKTSSDIVVSVEFDSLGYTFGYLDQGDKLIKKGNTGKISIPYNKFYRVYFYTSAPAIYGIFGMFEKIQFYHKESDTNPYIEYSYYPKPRESIWLKQDNNERVDLLIQSSDRPFYLIKRKKVNWHYTDEHLIITSVPKE